MPPKKRKAAPEGNGSSTVQEAPFKRPANSLDEAAESAAGEVPFKRPASSFEEGAEGGAQEVPFKRSASSFDGVATSSLGAVDGLGQLAFSAEAAAAPARVADAQPERPSVAEEAAGKQPDGAAPGTPSKAPGTTPQGAAQELASALLESGWRDALQSEFEKSYFAEIAEFVAKERSSHAVYPPPDKVFEALNLTPLGEVKAVILGQDPYHEPGQAHGLCFSVPLGIPPPASLKNIYKELAVDVPGFRAPGHGLLAPWAQQGVLLLNATLTVRGGHKEANSHAKCGWQRFTDAVISVINERCEGVVFLLWGGFAQKKGKLVNRARHRVIETAHPSPLSARKWHGCKTFSKCNSALKALGRAVIEWRLEGGSGGCEEKQTKLTALKRRSASDGQTKIAAGEGGACTAADEQTGLPLPEGGSDAAGDEQSEPLLPKGGSGAAGDEQSRGSSTGGDTQTQPALPKGGCSGEGADEQAETATAPQRGGAGDKEIKPAVSPGGLDGSGKKQTTLKFA